MHDGLDTALVAATLLSAVGSGVVAGILFAFSNFVMKALARLAPEQGVAAMQAINVTVLNAVFLSLFVGTAASCLAVAAITLWRPHDAGLALRLAGSAAYLVGCVGVTRLGNIPLNEALDRVDANSPAGAQFWPQYLTAWLRYNHLRTFAALGAAVLFTLALVRGI